MTELMASVVVLAMAGVASGLAWTVRKVIQHDEWLRFIRASLTRVEAKLDRLVERG